MKREQKVVKVAKKDKKRIEGAVKANDSNEDDEYDDQVASDDNNFIASDNEVIREQEDAARKERRRLKKERREERKKRREKGADSDQEGLDDDDLELINENKSRPRKLKKTGGGIAVDSDDEEQIDSYAMVKKEELDKKRQIKKKIFEKRGESTAADEDQLANQAQSLKDKFVTEDIDDLFGTPHDLEIVEKDIPERLQIKIGDRLSPTEQELEKEAEWIFKIIIDSLAIAGDQLFAQKISEIKVKIGKVLKLFRCENCDVPYITRYRQNELIPELEPDDVWRIFNLDIEYGKFQIQKKHCDDFFQKLAEFSDSSRCQMDHYKNQIFYTKDQRDLNDFVPLMNFYKSYYNKELSTVQANSSRKLPVQRKEFVSSARERRLDEFSRRCMLNPIQLVENIQEDRQLHKPNQPQNSGPTDMAKEYIMPAESSGKEGATGATEPLEIIKDMCVYTATELQCQPDIRRGFKKHIRDFGVLSTEPTDKGKKELDVFHPSYRVKRVSKKLKELQNTDLFLDIIQNENLGLIKFQIIIQDDNDDERIGNKYFQNMFEKFKFPEDTTKWRFLRREIFEIFSAQNTQTNKGQKSFLTSILDEIKIELKEDAERHVTSCCSQRYKELMDTGYFKIQNEQRQFNQKDGKRARAIEEDLIPQRERLNVMGAIIYPLDSRNFQTTIAVVDEYGELIAHKDFLYIIPPRKPRPGPDGEPPLVRPGEEEGARRHAADKRDFQEILREHKVDLIVVSADCHEAKRLKKALSEFANLKIAQDQMQENDDENQGMANDDDPNSKEAFVIWGRPEVPKLFATSHYSQKLLKNHPFVLKKAICLARFEQDPLNEVLNLWSPIMSENQALHLNLHPLQKHINQARLIDHLEQINTQYVNKVGIDINLLVDHDHWHNQLQFLSGLGPRKAQKYIQKLKSLGKPLYTRNEIYEHKILRKNCFVSSLGFTKVRVPPEKRPDDMQSNILDQTRIHLRNYDHVYKLVTDCLFENQPDIEQYKQQQAVNEIIKKPEKLKEFAMGEYKEQIKLVDKVGIGFIFDQIIEDLMHPFMDFREDKQIVRTPNEQRFSAKELFYSLIDETERTFRAGMIVSATVLRIYDSNGSLPASILCKLENGLDARIGEQDADFFPGAQDGNSVDQGSIVTGRVDMIKFGDKFNNDENYSISLKCKQTHLRRHDLYLEKLELAEIDVHEDDKINMNFKVQEDNAQIQQKSLIQKRKIQHQRFQNISSKNAMNQLLKEDDGEFYFRPSSRGNDHLTLTWKFCEGNIVHIDITELDKAIGANIGSKLKISDETYENLQEIVERYITPCNRSLREVTQHPKFIKCSNLEELQKAVEQEKEGDASRIPYKFTVLDKYPQYIVLAYMPKTTLVKEFIKVKPRGYFFHHQYHYPFQNMINWFKQEFRSREYQRYVRKTSSPQPVAAQGGAPTQAVVEPSGMQIDSSSAAAGNNWGANASVKNEAARASPEGAGWGGEPSQSVKDEREKTGGWGGQTNPGDAGAWGGAGNNWGSSGATGGDNQDMQSPPRSERSAGRGRGGGAAAGGSRACFKCGEEGHMSRECPTGGGGGGGTRACYKCGVEGHISRDCPDGGGAGSKPRGPMTCYNCQGEGHMSRECTEPRKERNDGDRPPYKRQRRDDGDAGNQGAGGWDNKPSDNAGWGGADAGNAGGGWGSNPAATPGGAAGWDAGGENQKQASQASGGRAQAAKPGGAPASQASDSAWGNNAEPSQNQGGGWN